MVIWGTSDRKVQFQFISARTRNKIVSEFLGSVSPCSYFSDDCKCHVIGIAIFSHYDIDIMIMTVVVTMIMIVNPF